MPAGSGSGSEGSNSARDAELKHVVSGMKHLLPPFSLLPVLYWSDPTRSQLTPQPGWHGLWGHPPGAQSRTDS